MTTPQPLAIEAGRTLLMRRIIAKQYGVTVVEVPDGTTFVHMAAHGSNVELSALCPDGDVPTVRRRIHFVPITDGARTPASASALALIGNFECGSLRYLVFEEANDVPAARAVA